MGRFFLHMLVASVLAPAMGGTAYSFFACDWHDSMFPYEFAWFDYRRFYAFGFYLVLGRSHFGILTFCICWGFSRSRRKVQNYLVIGGQSLVGYSVFLWNMGRRRQSFYSSAAAQSWHSGGNDAPGNFGLKSGSGVLVICKPDNPVINNRDHSPRLIVYSPNCDFLRQTNDDNAARIDGLRRGTYCRSRNAISMAGLNEAVRHRWL